MQLFFLFVQSGALRWRQLGNGTADMPKPLSNHISAQQVAFLGGKFLRMLFLQVGGLGQNKQFID